MYFIQGTRHEASPFPRAQKLIRKHKNSTDVPSHQLSHSVCEEDLGGPHIPLKTGRRGGRRSRASK
uniref:Uncharacterized protein n=1 Tax=Lotus japonicus TaxID=34305 RepID=I3SUZ6_LOTJA|nr:unknown [Lotus japonicus]